MRLGVMRLGGMRLGGMRSGRVPSPNVIISNTRPGAAIADIGGAAIAMRIKPG
jgi:hypothetical protein